MSSAIASQCIEIDPVAGEPLAAANFQTLTIHPMQAAELDLISVLENQIYPFPWSRGNFADSLKSGYEAWTVRTADNQIIAYAVTMWIPDEVHLLNISVAVGVQGKGLGRVIMHWLMARARQQKLNGMLLEVRPSNSVGISLYESLGFSRIGRRKAYYPADAGSREDAIVMFKSIPKNPELG